MDWEEYNSRQQHAEEIANTRRGFLGGSDATMVYKIGRKGLGAICTTDKKRIGVLLGFCEPQPFGGNKWTEAGRDFEDIYEETAKKWVGGYTREKRLTGKNYGRFTAIAHADYVDSEGAIYELKCVRKTTEKVLTAYYAQLQWYYMLGAEQVYLVHTQDPHEEPVVKFVEKNDGVIEALQKGLDLIAEYCEQVSAEECNLTTMTEQDLPVETVAALFQWQYINGQISAMQKELNRYALYIARYMQENRVDQIIANNGNTIVLDSSHQQLNFAELLRKYPQVLNDNDIYISSQTTIKELKQ